MDVHEEEREERDRRTEMTTDKLHCGRADEGCGHTVISVSVR